MNEQTNYNTNSIKPCNFNTNEISKKLGQLETLTIYLEEKLKEQNSQYITLEDKIYNFIDKFSGEINAIKFNIDNINDIFQNNFNKIKNSLSEQLEEKNDSIIKLIKDINKRIDNIEMNKTYNNNNNNNNNFNDFNNTTDIFNTNNNNNNYSSFKNSANNTNSNTFKNNNNNLFENRLSKLEKLFATCNLKPNRDIEINTGLAKIDFISKKFDDYSDKVTYNIDSINTDLNKIKTEIDSLKNFRKNIKNEFSQFQRDFISTNTNNDKFNYQTTLLLNQVKNKMSDLEENNKIFKDNFNNVKNNLIKDVNTLNDNVCNNLNKYKTIFNQNNNDLNKIVEEFKNCVCVDNEKFYNFIQDKLQKFFDKNNENYNINYQDILALKENVKNINSEIKNIKNSFFNQLNDIDDSLNKKITSINRIINLQ